MADEALFFDVPDDYGKHVAHSLLKHGECALMIPVLEFTFRLQTCGADSMAAKKKLSRTRTVTVKGVWHDHFANHWYEYPRKVPARVEQVPSIWLRGEWISAAGFLVGEKLEIEVSKELIALKVKRKM